MMTSEELIRRLKNIMFSFKTVYLWGVFGAPVTGAVIANKSAQYPDFYTKAKQAALRTTIGKGYFGFDCVNMIKAILWGWTGDPTKAFGGAKYVSNNVPDISADTMCTKFIHPSTNFSNIIPGEAVWMRGHIGIYIGEGVVIECTPSWANGVQITACLNIGPVNGLKGRKWTKHGKLPYVSYEIPITKVERPVFKPIAVGKEKEDPDLVRAVNTLHLKGIVNNPAVWGDMDKINLKNVPMLLKNMGGIDRLVKARIIEDGYLWLSGSYTKANVRSLLIKYSILG